MTCFLLRATGRSRTLLSRAAGSLLAFSLLAAAPYAFAAGTAGRTIPPGELVTYAVTPSPGTQETLVKVPPRGRLLVKQVCSDSPAAYVTLEPSGSRISYFRQYSCTHFDPGFVVRGGSELRCVNKAGTAHGCSVVGMLVRRLPEPAQRAVILEP